MQVIYLYKIVNLLTKRKNPDDRYLKGALDSFYKKSSIIVDNEYIKFEEKTIPIIKSWCYYSRDNVFYLQLAGVNTSGYLHNPQIRF